MIDFCDHGMYEIFIGDGNLRWNLVLVHFDREGVRFDVVDDCTMDGQKPLTIKEFKPHSTVTLSTKRQRADN